VSENQLAVESRQITGKGHARKLRAAGRIPAVCYSPSMEATPVQLDPNELDRVLRKSAAGMNTLIDLQGGGLDGKVVLVKALQRDPVRGSLLHADLFAIDAAKQIEVAIPVHVEGTPVGVTLGGGILDFPMREIEVLCLPGAIPEELRVDVSALELGESVHVRDVLLPEGVELISDADLTLISVVAPAKVEEEVVAAEEEAAEEVEGAAAEGAPAEGATEEAKSDED
jgi:large subunit ribosomal protein L25